MKNTRINSIFYTKNLNSNSTLKRHIIVCTSYCAKLKNGQCHMSIFMCYDINSHMLSHLSHLDSKYATNSIHHLCNVHVGFLSIPFPSNLLRKGIVWPRLRNSSVTKIYTCKLASLSWRKSIQVREGVLSLGNEWNQLKMSYFQSLRVNTFKQRKIAEW